MNKFSVRTTNFNREKYIPAKILTFSKRCKINWQISLLYIFNDKGTSKSKENIKVTLKKQKVKKSKI
jgi:hypothetical protein